MVDLSVVNVVNGDGRIFGLVSLRNIAVALALDDFDLAAVGLAVGEDEAALGELLGRALGLVLREVGPRLLMGHEPEWLLYLVLFQLQSLAESFHWGHVARLHDI